MLSAFCASDIAEQLANTLATLHMLPVRRSCYAWLEGSQTRSSAAYSAYMFAAIVPD